MKKGIKILKKFFSIRLTWDIKNHHKIFWNLIKKFYYFIEYYKCFYIKKILTLFDIYILLQIQVD